MFPDLINTWRIRDLQECKLEILFTKLILFLHRYKVDEVLLKLKEAEILKAELAVVCGKIKYELSQAYQDISPIIITQNGVRASCKKHISEAEFIRQPNNDIIHIQCNFDKSSRDNSLEILIPQPPLHLHLILNNQK
ncbi:hypothetical protein Glove_114g22 [Diversispora epigaea]|uniref:Uncharacterized protein n=1 Tax=Diversispora epigaea TaxID=1348612 RepID=A0A397JAK9_9GLOM|nr:hypothetical protein Glove_114g22 [Diversispora epigaea]